MVLGGPGEISSQPTTAPFLPMYFVTVAGPFLSGILMTGLCDGMQGYRDLLSRLLKWRVPYQWYLAALVVAPLTVFPALFALILTSPQYLPGIFDTGDNQVAAMFGLSNSKIALSLFVLILGLFNGFVEELGWTGYLTPRLKFQHHTITSGLGLGIMWGLWHLFSNYVGSASGAGTVPLPCFIDRFRR